MPSIINSDDGVVSGSSGLKTTGGNDGITNFQQNGTTQATITAAGLFQFNSGYGSVATAYGCRAWVNFNGTSTVAIRASGNVTSITDNGTGDYTVNFTTAMPDANYGVTGSCMRPDRVQNNMIGACLMAYPQKVAECIRAMCDATSLPVTLKHRIGINGRDSYAELCDFVGTVAEAGCRSFTVHARIAILEGLSPKENREIPPLRYEVARQLKNDFPHLEFILNGGIKTLGECAVHLQTFDGVMLGREAYHNPYLLAEVDRCLFLDTHDTPTRQQVALQMRTYIEAHLQQGGQMQHITRHMLGLAQGFPGARRFRQLLSADIHRHPEPLALYDEACKLLEGR